MQNHRRHAASIALVLAVVASVLAFAPTTSGAATQTVTAYATADGRVSSRYPNANYSSSALHAAASPVEVSYLRFDVPTGSGTLASAKLRLYATSNEPGGVDVRAAGNSWSESTLTWRRRSSTNGLVGRSTPIFRNTWVEIDITDDVVVGTTQSFVLNGADDVWFRSSEQTNPPRLVLEFDDGAPEPTDVTVSVDRSSRQMTSSMAVGTTLNRFTLRPDGDPAAIARGEDMQRKSAVFQIQPVMGNGARNPNPSPGVYDWESLDDQIAQIERTGGIPVINMWGAPDWMKGGQPGETEWGLQEVAPLPEYYDDFAELARRVAIRYPQVRHYIVWNETKGLWNRDLANYDYVEYTRMYNKIYDALKMVDSSIAVGGPYLVIEGTGSLADNKIFTREPLLERNLTFLQYWLDHARGADFLAVDRKIAQRKDEYPYSRDELMALTPWFAEVNRRLQQVTSLPIWWTETYFRCDTNPQFMAAGLASMLRHQLIAGSAVSLRWSPERQPGADEAGCVYPADDMQNLWTSTQVPGGGQPLPAFEVYEAFKRNFGPGRSIYETTTTSTNLEALANWSVTLLVNKSPQTLTVRIDGDVLTLPPYDVMVHDRNA
ncbi:DNRLRE domain-containing protein [Actinospongicola halichondriae]|uniref:DNRLRE domain-containing protein n=1 Tax=Actinospongicola halichondriae TaxID=3236844 RepID=UPI003D50CA0D